MDDTKERSIKSAMEMARRQGMPFSVWRNGSIYETGAPDPFHTGRLLGTARPTLKNGQPFSVWWAAL